jgi:hypothetical protein
MGPCIVLEKRKRESKRRGKYKYGMEEWPDGITAEGEGYKQTEALFSSFALLLVSPSHSHLPSFFSR